HLRAIAKKGSKLCFSQDCRLLAIISKDVQLCDVATGEVKRRLGSTKWAEWNDAVLSPDGTTVAVAGFDTSVALFNLLDDGPRRSLGSFPWRMNDSFSRIGSLAFSCDGRTLAAAGYGTSIYVFDVEKQKCCLSGHNHWIQGVAMSPD